MNKNTRHVTMHVQTALLSVSWSIMRQQHGLTAGRHLVDPPAAGQYLATIE